MPSEGENAGKRRRSDSTQGAAARRSVNGYRGVQLTPRRLLGSLGGGRVQGLLSPEGYTLLGFSVTQGRPQNLTRVCVTAVEGCG